MQLKMKITKERRNSLWLIGVLWVISGIVAGVTSSMKTLRRLLNMRIKNTHERRVRRKRESGLGD